MEFEISQLSFRKSYLMFTQNIVPAVRNITHSNSFCPK